MLLGIRKLERLTSTYAHDCHMCTGVSHTYAQHLPLLFCLSSYGTECCSLFQYDLTPTVQLNYLLCMRLGKSSLFYNSYLLGCKYLVCISVVQLSLV